jgi:hypothetical protein
MGGIFFDPAAHVAGKSGFRKLFKKTEFGGKTRRFIL